MACKRHDFPNFWMVYWSTTARFMLFSLKPSQVIVGAAQHEVADFRNGSRALWGKKTWNVCKILGLLWKENLSV